jgi:hypothetical protein
MRPLWPLNACYRQANADMEYNFAPIPPPVEKA